jgi:hypothetical protein
MAGISLSGRMFVFHTTDHTDRVTMGRSVVAASDDDGATFRLLSDLSRRHFINVSVCDVDARRWAGLPEASGRTLLYFGSGSYRASDMRLAAQPASNIGTRDGMRYCTGIGLDGRPTWSQSEEEAIGLLGQADIGELSVAYYPSLRKWVLLHNGHKPLRGIVMRTADAPWGPWSPGRLLFQPWLDGGYGRFMHVSRRAGGTDRLSDPGREDEWGGEYGPYQIPWFASVRGAETTIFFTMSTWNPYQVVLMKATLRRR